MTVDTAYIGRPRIDFIGYKNELGKTVSSSRSGASTPIETSCVRAEGVECISWGMT